MPTKSTQLAISSWLLRSTGNFGIRSIPQYSSALGSSQGRTRENNQDRVLAASFEGEDAKEAFEFFAVCDGMGGLREGAECASLALGHMLAHLVRTRREFDRPSRLKAAIDAASKAVYERYKEQGGTTIAAVLMNRNGGTGIAVGDTRLYLHESSGDLTQMSVDDTIAGRVADLTGEDPLLAEQGPFANHLAQFVGQGGSVKPQIIDLRTVFSDFDVAPGRRPRGVLITSDGVHRIAKPTFSAIVKEAVSPKDAVWRLIHVAEWSGAQDNESAIYIAAAPRSPSIGFTEGMPNLRLQDPFGDFQLNFAVPEELAEFSSYAVRDKVQSMGRDFDHYRTTKTDPQEKHLYRVGAGPREDARLEVSALDRTKAAAGPAGQGERAGSASDDRSRFTEDHGAVVRTHPTPKEGGSVKRANRGSAKGRRKGGKGRKTKGKGGDDPRDSQPEFDILISQETE